MSFEYESKEEAAAAIHDACRLILDAQHEILGGLYPDTIWELRSIMINQEEGIPILK